MEKKVLIMGGLGYIGSVLYDLAKNQAWNVSILDNHLYKEIDPKNEFINSDIRNKKEIEEIIKDFDIIVNLAAVVGNPGCLVDTNLAINVNCIGARNIAEVCKLYDKKIIHISTCSIYGSEPDRIVKESDDAFPIGFYGQTKYTQERTIRKICRENSCILRLGTVYGLSPRMRYDLVINLFVGKAINFGKISVFGGEQKRPFVHIKDVGRAILFAIENNLYGTYNLPGENTTIIDVAKRVKKITGCKIKVEKDITDKRSYFADGSKILKKGFKFKNFIEDGILEISESLTIKNMNDIIYSNFRLCETLYLSKLLRGKDVKIIEPEKITRNNRTEYEFNFPEAGVKIFKEIEKLSKNYIKTWKCYEYEARYLYTIKGSINAFTIKINNPKNPSKDKKINRFVLTDKNKKFLFIPPRNAYTFMALKEGTKICSFSTRKGQVSINEVKKYPREYWGQIWDNKKNRN